MSTAHFLTWRRDAPDCARLRAIFACLLALQVRWLFNNEPITSPHFRIGSRPDGAHTLHISEVFDEDAGRFSVLAENEAGKATCSALLVVVDESQILPRDESPPETPLKRTAPPLGFGPPPVVPPAKQVTESAGAHRSH